MSVYVNYAYWYLIYRPIIVQCVRQTTTAGASFAVFFWTQPLQLPSYPANIFFMCVRERAPEACLRNGKSGSIVVGWLLPKSEERLHWNCIWTPVRISHFLSMSLFNETALASLNASSQHNGRFYKVTACVLRLSACLSSSLSGFYILPGVAVIHPSLPAMPETYTRGNVSL